MNSGKLVYGISVAEKKILWLKLRAEGVAGHGSQPNDQNPNDRLVRALGRLAGGLRLRNRRGEVVVNPVRGHSVVGQRFAPHFLRLQTRRGQ